MKLYPARWTASITLVILVCSRGAQAQAPGEFVKKWVPRESTKVVKIEFKNSFDGSMGSALLELPPKMTGPTPLIVSPHPANWSAETNRSLWTGIAEEMGVMILHPIHQGNTVPAVSLGGERQMANLWAAIAQVEKQYSVDTKRIYASGLSQGATESLLLAGLRPQKFAGVLVFNPVADFSAFYNDVPTIRDLLEKDCSGTPTSAAKEYARRSPTTYAAQLARLPVTIYWAQNDELIPNGAASQGGKLCDLIRAAGGKLLREVRHANQHAYPFCRFDATTKKLEVYTRDVFVASVKDLLGNARRAD